MSAIGWVMIAYSSNCLIKASIAEGDSIINATLLLLLPQGLLTHFSVYRVNSGIHTVWVISKAVFTWMHDWYTILKLEELLREHKSSPSPDRDLNCHQNVTTCLFYHPWLNLVFSVTASVGLWTFIDQAVNLRNLSSMITTFNTPFVPAVENSSTNVISFLGHKDSYVLLENTGDLAVSSFTWSAMIFPERTGDGPLFNWCINGPPSGYSGNFIWQVSSQILHFRILGSGGHSLPPFNSITPMSLNEWHHVAISYDGNTGVAMNNVDGIVQTVTLPLSTSDATVGSVMMGSHYYCDNGETRTFQGKMACVRLEHRQKSQHHENGHTSLYNNLI